MSRSSGLLNDVDQTSQRIDHTSLGVLGAIGITQRQSLRIEGLRTDRTGKSRLGKTVDPYRLTIPRVVTNVAQVQVVDPCLGSWTVGNVLVVGVVDAANVPVLNNPTIVLVDCHQTRGVVAIVVHIQYIGVASTVDHTRNLVGKGSIDLAHLNTAFIRNRRRAVSIGRFQIFQADLGSMLLDRLGISAVLPRWCWRAIASRHNTSAVGIEADVVAFAIDIVITAKCGISVVEMDEDGETLVSIHVIFLE